MKLRWSTQAGNLNAHGSNASWALDLLPPAGPPLMIILGLYGELLLYVCITRSSGCGLVASPLSGEFGGADEALSSSWSESAALPVN
jgi:hypothetical protein